MANGWCYWRALAEQHYGDEHRYMEIKDAMLLVARANKDTYKKHICYKSEEEYEMIVNTLEHGLTPETEHERNKFCSSKYWFDTSTMSQIAADALRRLIADFATEINTVHPPRLYLPLSPPLFDARPAPYILHSLNNHFYSLKIRSSVKTEWPSFLPYHRVKWKYLPTNKTTRCMHTKHVHVHLDIL